MLCSKYHFPIFCPGVNNALPTGQSQQVYNPASQQYMGGGQPQSQYQQGMGQIAPPQQQMAQTQAQQPPPQGQQQLLEPQLISFD